MGLLDMFLGGDPNRPPGATSPDMLSFLPEAGSAASNNLLDVGQALGMSLLQGNRQQPFANVAQNLAAVSAMGKSGTTKSALKALLVQAGYTDAEAEKLSSSEGVAKLAIQQKQQQKLLGDGGDAEPALFGGGAPAMSPAAPPGPAAGASLNGGTLSGDMGAFAGAIKAKESGGRYDIVGPTHPKYGRALGAYQVMESNLPQWSQEALGRQVTPDEFLKNPEIQDAIFAKKFGQSIEKYGNPQDAASVWFTGRPAAQGATAKDVLGTTGANYVASFNANLARQRPTQVADASGAVPLPVAPTQPPGLPIVDSRQPGFDPNNGVDPLAGFVSSTGQTNALPATPRRVAVAANEQEAQALESQMGMLPPTAPDRASPADMPAPGAQEAGFVIPPGAQAAVEKQVGAPPTPVNPNIGPTTQRAQALANYNYWAKRLRASSALGEAGKGLMEESKLKMGLAAEYLKPTDTERLADAAGLAGEDRQRAIAGSISGNADTSMQKEYNTYRKQEAAAGRVPLSQFEYDVALSKAKASSTKVEVGGQEKTYDADQGKTYSGLMTEIQAAARKAPTTLATLNEAERLMSTPGFVSGIGTEKFILPFKQVAAKLGGDPNAPAAMESVRALANKAVTDQLGGSLGAGVSNADVSFLQKQNASLDNSVEANRTLIGYAKRLAERQREVAGLAREYAAKNGGRLDVGFERELDAYARANPVFPEGAETAPAQGSTGRGQPAPGAPARAAPTAAEMNATERAQSIQNAKAYIAQNPAKREAVKARLQSMGIPTDAL